MVHAPHLTTSARPLPIATSPDGYDENILLSILRGEYQISGMSNRLFQRVLPEKTGGQIGRILKRLRLHGLIKKIGHTYKSYLTALGRKGIDCST